MNFESLYYNQLIIITYIINFIMMENIHYESCEANASYVKLY